MASTIATKAPPVLTIGSLLDRAVTFPGRRGRDARRACLGFAELGDRAFSGVFPSAPRSGALARARASRSSTPTASTRSRSCLGAMRVGIVPVPVNGSVQGARARVRRRPLRPGRPARRRRAAGAAGSRRPPLPDACLRRRRASTRQSFGAGGDAVDSGAEAGTPPSSVVTRGPGDHPLHLRHDRRTRRAASRAVGRPRRRRATYAAAARVHPDGPHLDPAAVVPRQRDRRRCCVLSPARCARPRGAASSRTSRSTSSSGSAARSRSPHSRRSGSRSSTTRASRRPT